jgi:cold shock CspA family protein
MAKSQETFSKKEKEKQKIRKRKEKEEKKETRKANSNKGQGIESMMAYVDENGNLTSVPPDPKKKKEFNAEDMIIGTAKQVFVQEDPIKTGIVSFFNEDKGYGFIKETLTKEGVFVHMSNLLTPIKEGNKVQFEIESNQKGPYAAKVQIIP